MDLLEKKEVGSLENTKLIYMQGKNNYRIFKGKEYVYINSKYIEMIDEDNVKFEGNGALYPIFATYQDDLILIMPFRMGDNSEYLKA
ncbi:hypothetical protein KQI42_20620 [Tissierella sp. MSJ-40]|uniref:Uncharacterized protein n=1 Tax=Tissierella simiarum TaxID=2841534 RepID=A0ABS6EBT7_9FIRM|nr:hypothetical protein [Tissierella simiarum]MBU5440401.1 hypothetical protein [Tissierella simiarum]